MNCATCNTPLAVDAAVCTVCGTATQAAASADDRAGSLGSLMGAIGAAPSVPAELGRVLEDRYRVDAFLARGGMGEVFVGTDLRLPRRVAIKLLAFELQRNKDLARRFVREAHAAAALDHPTLLNVYSVGESDGRPYIVMKFIEGQTVAQLIRERGRLPLSEVIPIATQVCDGLAYIHARQLVHRDIKPSNLMVEPDGRCTILDFGLLRVADSTMTSVGFLGTPAYVAPEQARDPRLADPRSDLYALGASLFDMFAGRPPFEARSTMELLVKVHGEAPTPLESLVPDLPSEVAAIVHKALAKAPEDRFQSAGELKAALSSFVGADAARGAPVPPTLVRGAPAAAGHRTPQARGEGGSNRTRRGLVAAIVFGALAAAIAIPVLRETPTEPPTPPSRAIEAPAAPPALPPAPAPATPAPEVSPTPRAAPADRAPNQAAPSLATAVEAPQPAPKSPATKRVARKRSTPPRARPARSDEGERVSATAAETDPKPPSTEAPPKPRPPPAIVEPSPPPKPRAPIEGSLRVVTLYRGEGTWATISIDGEVAGETHTVVRRLREGFHVVEVRRPGYRDERRHPEVVPGQTTTLRIDLQKK